MTGAPLWLRPARRSARTSAALEREAELLVVGRVLGLRVDADGAAALAALALASASTSSNVGILNSAVELLRALAGGAPNGCTARSVLISASVKSEAKKSCRPAAVDHAVLLAARRTRAGATSVVPPMFGSWRAIRYPSLVATRSGSM